MLDRRATEPYPTGKWKYVPLNKVPASYILKTFNNFKNTHPDLWQYIKESKLFLMALGDRPLSEEEVKPTCDKMSYCDEKTARIELGRIRAIVQEHKKPIRVYECDKCNQWHLTSMPIEVFKESKQ